MKDNREFINGIYEKYEEYKKDTHNASLQSSNNKNAKENNMQGINWKNSKENYGVIKHRKTLKNVLVYAIAITIAISGVAVTNNYINQEQTIVGKTETFDKISLKTVGSFENLYTIAKEYSDNNSSSYNSSDDELIDFATAAESMSTDTESSDSSSSTSTSKSSTSTSTSQNTGDYSNTNIQVEGVDEADIVKTDGNYIYYVVNNKILITDISEKDSIKKVAQIDFTDEEFEPSEIYINGENLIILGDESSYKYSSTTKETTGSIYKKRNYEQKAVAKIYDLSNISEPEEERTIEIEGCYISSRMIGNNIYFVGNKTLNATNIVEYYDDEIEENSTVSTDTFNPTYTDTLKSSSEKVIDLDEVYYFEEADSLNYLTLAGFSLDNKKEADVKTFLGAGEDVYSSTKNMYIVKAKSTYDADTNEYLGDDTKILKFSLSAGEIEFKAEANVEGQINNQFSMDENDEGYFRIATTLGVSSWDLDDEDSSSNSLYVLDENLKEVGRIDGIAKGEKIYSVRYSGDKAYVVTFKQTDPLFVIDLSNPKEPEILGELKIPGYSTYLQPYDETHLIGFGYDTKMNSSENGVAKDGLKMTMFDISDLSNPKELFTVKIGDSYLSSELTTNHKALLFSKEKNIIAFPVSGYKSGKYTSKAQVYSIDLDKGFTLQCEISNDTIEKSGSSRNKIQRIIYSNDVYYTLSPKMIKATDMSTFEEITKLEI